jgi:hypothetical protein
MKKENGSASSKKDEEVKDLNLVTLVYAIKDNTKNMLLYIKYIDKISIVIDKHDYEEEVERAEEDYDDDVLLRIINESIFIFNKKVDYTSNLFNNLIRHLFRERSPDEEEEVTCSEDKDSAFLIDGLSKLHRIMVRYYELSNMMYQKLYMIIGDEMEKSNLELKECDNADVTALKINNIQLFCIHQLYDVNFKLSGLLSNNVVLATANEESKESAK